MAEPHVLLRAEGLAKWFGATHALRGVSLELRAGEIHALAGANGSGKSTLVKILSGAYPADGGETTAAPGLVIGTVHQNLGLFGEATVRENVCAALPARILSAARESGVVERLFAQIGVAIPAEAKVQELPIDQQAFVAVARALARTADAPGAVLIVDEVTSVLRGEAAERFAAVLRRLRARGLGIVLVSHDLDEVLGLADRITVITDGSVRAVEHSGDLDRDRLIELMTGVPVETAAAGAAAAAGKRAAVLSVSGLTGDLLHDLDLEVRAGEVVALIGVPGSGYDEAPYLIAGAGAARHSGTVELGGHPVRTPGSFAERGGRLIPADRGRTALVGTGSVLENYMLGHRGGHGRWGLRLGRHEQRLAREALRRYGVKCAGIHAPVTSLSGGNQQKLIMGRCLDAAPRLLVLHEPTQGVDVRARAELLAHMHRAVREQGLGVLYVCGDLNEVWDNAHRVVVIRRGRKAGEADVAGTAKESVHQLLY